MFDQLHIDGLVEDLQGHYFPRTAGPAHPAVESSPHLHPNKWAPDRTHIFVWGAKRPREHGLGLFVVEDDRGMVYFDMDDGRALRRVLPVEGNQPDHRGDGRGDQERE
jgi:hypothetical protein